MTEHPNVARVRAAYAAFENADLNGALADLAVDAVFHFGGEGPNSGDHKGREAIETALINNFELTGGTQKLHVHSIFADDEHAVVSLRETANRTDGGDAGHRRGARPDDRPGREDHEPVGPAHRRRAARPVLRRSLTARRARARSAARITPRSGALPLIERPGHVVLQGRAGRARIDADEIPGADVVRGGVPRALQELVGAAVLTAG